MSAEASEEEHNLTDPWPDLAGRLTPHGHRLAVRVYYEDTDFSGLVYHASYLKFMERGRSDMLRLLGISHDALNEGVYGEPLSFAVHHMNVSFLKPARIDDLVEIETVVAGVAGARLVLDQTVRRGGVPLVNAAVTVVVVNGAGRARRLPAEVRASLARMALE